MLVLTHGALPWGAVSARCSFRLWQRNIMQGKSFKGCWLRRHQLWPRRSLEFLDVWEERLGGCRNGFTLSSPSSHGICCWQGEAVGVDGHWVHRVMALYDTQHLMVGVAVPDPPREGHPAAEPGKHTCREHAVLSPVPQCSSSPSTAGAF